MVWMRIQLVVLFILPLVISGCSGKEISGTTPKPRQLLVSAAISLKDAFDEIEMEFEGENRDVGVAYNFAASGALQIQIEQGAGVDVFASAGETQMDALERKGLIMPGTRRPFAENAAVLVVPRDNGPAIDSFADLVKPEVKRVAIGNPTSVPAGDYARQVLESVGIWNDVQRKIVYAENVRQVLTYVEQGNVDAGIVYRTDSASSKKVKVVATAPEGSLRPIAYPIAVIANSRSPSEARKFVDFVAGPEGQAILAEFGFLAPPETRPTPVR